MNAAYQKRSPAGPLAPVLTMITHLTAHVGCQQPSEHPQSHQCSRACTATRCPANLCDAAVGGEHDDGRQAALQRPIEVRKALHVQHVHLQENE